MVFILSSTILTLVALVVGSISDLKTREVPDWVNYGLFFTALALRIFMSVTEKKFGYIGEGLVGFVVMVAFSYLLFYSGQMGGGDAKLLMAMGMMMGLPFSLYGGMMSMLAAFVINSLFIGAGYGVCWSIVLGVLHWKNISQAFQKYYQQPRIKKIRKAGIVLCVVLLFIALNVALPLKILCFTFIVTYLIVLYSYLFVKSVENVCMIKEVPVFQATLGDWVSKPVRIDGKIIIGKKELGITEEQLKQLRKYAKQNKIKKISIRSGIPFVPSFLISYIATILFGNLLFAII